MRLAADVARKYGITKRCTGSAVDAGSEFESRSPPPGELGRYATSP